MCVHARVVQPVALHTVWCRAGARHRGGKLPLPRRPSPGRPHGADAGREPGVCPARRRGRGGHGTTPPHHAASPLPPRSCTALADDSHRRPHCMAALARWGRSGADWRQHRRLTVPTLKLTRAQRGCPPNSDDVIEVSVVGAEHADSAASSAASARGRGGDMEADPKMAIHYNPWMAGWCYFFLCDTWAMSTPPHMACERNDLSAGRGLLLAARSLFSPPPRCARHHLLSGACA